MISLETLRQEVKDFDMRPIAGKNGLSRQVRWVHMAESLEISAFLSGNEVIFITGIGLQPHCTLLELVQSLQQKNASGIVLNIGPYITAVPPQVIQFCDAHRLPLFSVPWKVHMAEIMRAFCMKILDLERQALQVTQAIETAIYFPNQPSAYLPFFESSGLRKNARYCLALLELLERSKPASDTSLRRLQLKTRLDLLLFRAAGKTHTFLLEKYCALLFVDTKSETIKALLDKIQALCVNFLEDGEQFHLALGAQQRGASAIHLSFQQAKQALHLQKKADASNEAILYEELGLYKLLFAVKDKAALKRYYEETLGNLFQYDRFNHTTYHTVLAVYLKNNGSVKQTAATLYMHRNTAVYQIHKIEEILQCDLSKLETRAAYLTALMVKHLL